MMAVATLITMFTGAAYVLFSTGNPIAMVIGIFFAAAAVLAVKEVSENVTLKVSTFNLKLPKFGVDYKEKPNPVATRDQESEEDIYAVYDGKTGSEIVPAYRDLSIDELHDLLEEKIDDAQRLSEA